MPTPKRRRAWLWVAASALLALAPAGWLGAEYALDNERMAEVQSELASVRALIDRSAGSPDESGEMDACERAALMLAELKDPPLWRHVAFSLLEDAQVQAASARIAELRAVVAERRSNRAWWKEQAAAMDAALAAPDRTIPDLFALRDSVESASPPHPESGGLAPDGRSAALARIEAEAATLTDAQDRLLRQFVSAGELVSQASDPAALDAALASAPGADARDLNPPELDMVRERLSARAEAIRAEFAFRTALEASIAGALSRALALDPETAAATDAYAVVADIDAVIVPEGARYVPLVESRSQALETARRRLALLEARDLDRAWLDRIAAAVPGASTARDAQALLLQLQEEPPGGCDLESVSQRAAEIRDALRSRLQARRDQSRAWREDLAAAVDAMVAARALSAFASAADRLDALLALGSSDPSSMEDAQAERAARAARRSTAVRLVRAELAPVAESISRITDPRQLPPEVAAALSEDSPVASMEEAKELVASIRQRLAARLAEYEAFDGAIDRARVAMRDGDVCAAAIAISEANPRTAEQEWTRSDLRGAVAELAMEQVESLMLRGGTLGSGTLSRLERIVQCPALESCAPDAFRMAARGWADVRIEADRALWEDCRQTALDALERRDPTTYLGAVSRYIASGGRMQAAAAAARDAFAAPSARVTASEFVWGASSCLPIDMVGDITITVDGDTWSGPIPTGEPGKVARLSHEWSVRSGSDAVTVSASGVSPCEDPQPFAGLGEIPLNDRRFGASIDIPCPAVGADGRETGHVLRLKVIPSVQWASALRLPPWRPPQDPQADGSADGAPAELPPRPESDQPPVTEPTPDTAQR